MPVKSFLRPLISGALLGLMLTFPLESRNAAGQALSVFAQNVLPALFPFTACVLILTAGRSVPLPALLLLSWLGGSPTGARLISAAPLDPKTARRAARACGTMSPMFFLGTLAQWLPNADDARLALFCHLFAAVLLSLPVFSHASGQRVLLPGLTVFQALRDSVSGMLTVAACLIMGAVGARMIACLFPFLPDFPLALMQCAAEVTLGCHSLITLQIPLLLPLLCAVTSFSGLSILMQNAAFLEKHGITLKNLLQYGLLRAGISFLACFLILLCHSRVFAL